MPEYNDALSQTVRMLVEVGGLSDAEAFRTAIEQSRQEMTLSAQAMRDMETPALEMIRTLKTMQGGINLLEKALKEFEKQTTESMEVAGAAFESTLVPIGKLIDSGLKLQDTLDNIAEKSAKKLQKSLEDAIAVTTTELAASGLKLQDRIDKDTDAQFTKLINGLKKKNRDAEKEIEVTLESLQVKGAKYANKLADDQIAATNRSKKAQEDAILSTLVPLERLQVQGAKYANKLADDQISATKRANKAAEDSIDVTLEQLQMAGIKFQDKVGPNWAQRNAQGILHVAHAFQDLQYGVGAVLNNIPLVVQAFGGGAAAAGGLMIGMVALDMAANALGITFQGTAEALGFVNKEAETTEERLKRLSDKKTKIALDYTQIEDAKKEIEKASEAMAQFNSAKVSTPEEELKKSAASALKDFGGGQDAMIRAIMQSSDLAMFQNQADVNIIKKAKWNLEHPDIDARTGVPKTDPSVWRNQIEATQRKIEIDMREAIKNEIGLFASRDEPAIKRMKDRVRGMPQAFGNVGPGGVTFGEAIMNVPDNIAAMTRMMDIDEEDRRMDDFNANNLAGFKAFRKRQADAAKAKKEADKKVDDLNILGRENEALGLKEQREAAEKRRIDELTKFNLGLGQAKRLEGKQQREAAAEARKDAREAAQDAREQTKEDKERLLADRIGKFHGVVRSQLPNLTQMQSLEAARDAMAAHDNGMTVEAALQKTLMAIIRSNEQQERLANYIGEYTIRLNNIEGRQMQMQGGMQFNQQRNMQRRPILGLGRGVR